LPDGDLVLNVEAASTELLGLLTQACAARSDPVGQLIYRLSPAGVSRMFESGWDEAKLIGTLQKTIGQPLPRAWHEAIAQWWTNFGTLHLYADVAVIELADEYALAELLAGVAGSLLHRFSPRLIAVCRGRGRTARRSDRKGYTPKTMINDNDHTKTTMSDDLKSILERYSAAIDDRGVSWCAPRSEVEKDDRPLTRVLIEPRTIEKSVAGLSQGERAAGCHSTARGHAPVAQIRGERCASS
jgi:hypothetical protein